MHIHKVLEQPWRDSFPRNCASVLKFHTHHTEQHQPPTEQKATTIDLIIYKHSKQSFDKHQKQKDTTLDLRSVLISVSYISNKKKNLSRCDHKANTCD